MSEGSPDHPKRPRRWVRRLVILVVLLLGVNAALIWWGQRFLMYPGAYVSHNVVTTTPPDAELWTLDTDQGPVQALLMPGKGATAEQPGPAVIYCHGNGELIHIWPGEMRWYTQRGYTVLLPEFRGYGESAGSPSQAHIVDDMLRFYDRLVALDSVDPERIVLHGRSMGGGVVAQIADQRPSYAMIIASSFTSMADEVATVSPLPRFLVRDPYPVESVLREYGGPVLILHGEADGLIPVEQAHANAAVAKDATLVTYPGIDHNGTPPNDGNWPDILSFLDAHGLPWQVVGKP